MARREPQSRAEVPGAVPDASLETPAASPPAAPPPAVPPAAAPTKVHGVKQHARYLCIYNVNRPERTYSPNEIIAGLSAADAARLLALGAIKLVE